MENKKIYITWKGKQFALDAEWIYISNQVQRIKISFGEKSFVLENNYPLTLLDGAKKAIIWKLKQGTVKDAQFLQDVIRELEDIVKRKKPFKWDDHPKNIGFKREDN